MAYNMLDASDGSVITLLNAFVLVLTADTSLLITPELPVRNFSLFEWHFIHYSISVMLS